MMSSLFEQFANIQDQVGSHFFVMGTDTDAGKSIFTWQYVAWLRKQGSKAVILKPAECETPGNKDSDFFTSHLGKKSCFATYSFDQPVSPHFEARRTNQTIDFDRVAHDFHALKSVHDQVIIEGAGGVLCPLGDGGLDDPVFMADLNRHLEVPAVLVVRNRVGCLNHTLMSVMALRERGVFLAGLVVNGNDNLQNIEELPLITEVPLLAIVPWCEDWA